jgi:hypothetical protein
MYNDRRLKLSQELDVLIVAFYKGADNKKELEAKRAELEKVIMIHEQMTVNNKVSYSL